MYNSQYCPLTKLVMAKAAMAGVQGVPYMGMPGMMDEEYAEPASAPGAMADEEYAESAAGGEY